MPLRVFIGHDSREPSCAPVLAYSLIKHASVPLDIRFLVAGELDFERPRESLQSTEFTYTRFLVPHLCEFRGTALYLDGDMVCTADVAELARLDMAGLALRVVKHDHRPVETRKMDGVAQTAYPRKNWSSLMLMNCAALTLWSRTIVETESGAYLHRFRDIPDERIGELPDGWNDLDRHRPGTRLLHYTSGGPWFEEYADHPDGDLWRRYRDEHLAVARIVERRPPLPDRRRP